MNLNLLTNYYLNQQVSGYVSKDQNQKKLNQYLRLDLGENLLGCSPKVFSSLKNLNQKDLNYYADPSGEKLKNKIADVYSLNKSNVILANSSNEIIEYLPKMVLNPKEKALIILPTFFRFIESTLSAGGKIVYRKRIKKDLSDIKLIWLANPNNPTGTVLYLDRIENILKKTKALVILDEAFYEYYDLTNKDSGVNLINQYPNLIVLRTLSKAYGLAGLRLGYALAHKKTIKLIERCQNTLLMTSSVVQKIALTALEDQGWLKKTVNQTKKLRNQVLETVKKNPDLHLLGESQTNIYLIKHKRKDIYQELKKRGILTADLRNEKGLEKQKYVRVTVGNEQDNKKLLKVIKSL